jgi:hypothetical protein
VISTRMDDNRWTQFGMPSDVVPTPANIGPTRVRRPREHRGRRHQIGKVIGFRRALHPRCRRQPAVHGTWQQARIARRRPAQQHLRGRTAQSCSQKYVVEPVAWRPAPGLRRRGQARPDAATIRPSMGDTTMTLVHPSFRNWP